jgi:hypothetical protein
MNTESHGDDDDDDDDADDDNNLAMFIHPCNMFRIRHHSTRFRTNIFYKLLALTKRLV